MKVRLAWRNIWRNKRRTVITISSISLGLAFAVFYTAMHDGVNYQLINQGVRMQAGHITIEHPGYRDAPAIDLFIKETSSLEREIEKMEGIVGLKRLVLGNGMARTAFSSEGVLIMGIEPSADTEISPLSEHISEGRYLNDTDNAQVLIGSKLAKNLKIESGKKVVVTTNDVDAVLTEVLCRVSGIFDTGIDEVDSSLLVVPIDFSRSLFRLPEDSASQLGIYIKNPGKLNKFLRRLEPRLKDRTVSVHPWKEVMPELISYLRVDRAANFIFQGILAFIILFTIFNTVLMSVLERKHEFAVLQALGTPSSLLRFELFLESAFVGLIGCLIGLTIGGLVSYAIQVWGLDVSRIYGNSLDIAGFAVSPVIHARVTVKMLVGLGGIIFGATLLLSLIPMRRAAQVEIVDTLK